MHASPCKSTTFLQRTVWTQFIMTRSISANSGQDIAANLSCEICDRKSSELAVCAGEWSAVTEWCDGITGPPSRTGKKWSWSLRWGERKKKKEAVWTRRQMLTGISGGGRRVWLCDVSAVTVSTPTLDLMSVDWRAQGQKATKLPYNLLSRFTDNIKWSDLLFKKLKSCCKIIQGKENCWGVWKLAYWWCLNTEWL